MKLKDLYENLHLKKSDDHTEKHEYQLIDTDDLQYINFNMALPKLLHINHKNDKAIIEKMEMFVNNIGVDGVKNTERLLDFIEHNMDIFNHGLITMLKNILSKKYYGYSDWFIPSIEECLNYKEQIPNNIASSSFHIRNFGFLKTQIGSKAIDDNNDPFSLKLILIRKK